MASSGMLRRVALVRTDVEALSSSETSVLTRATRRNNPEDSVLRNRSSFLNVVFWLGFRTMNRGYKLSDSEDNLHYLKRTTLSYYSGSQESRSCES
jgi:hypothetical protein